MLSNLEMLFPILGLICPWASFEFFFIVVAFPLLMQMLPTNITVGQETLDMRGLNFDGYFFWISLGALFGFALILNIGFTLAISFLNRKYNLFLY